MTNSGSSPFTRTNPFASATTMLPPSFESNEFEPYDADDAHHTAATSLFDFTGGDILDASVFGESKLFPSGPDPSAQPNSNKAVSGFSSLTSHRGSSSSSSSRMSGNSTSPKTSHSSTDVMVTDESFPSWNIENDGRHNDTNFMFDTLDPTTMDMSNVFDFDSASSSPSPPTEHHIQESMAGKFVQNGPAPKRLKGHHKGQSVRLFVCTLIILVRTN